MDGDAVSKYVNRFKLYQLHWHGSLHFIIINVDTRQILNHLKLYYVIGFFKHPLVLQYSCI